MTVRRNLGMLRRGLLAAVALLVCVSQASAVLAQEVTEEPAPEEPAPLNRRQRVALAISPLLAGGGFGMLLGAVSMDMRALARGSLTHPDGISCGGQPCAPSELQKAWEDTRRNPYIIASFGSTMATTAAVVLVTAFERKQFPWWGSLMSATAGFALSIWGIVDIAHGDPCNVQEKVTCAEGQEQLDSGVIKLIGAVPFFAVPIVQGIRRATEPRPRWSDEVAIFPSVESLRAVSINARIRL
jgi:hypothetical protein